MKTYLDGYRLGATAIRIWRKKGYAIGKGQLKKVLHDWLISMNRDANASLRFESSQGFIDAILDSIN